MNFDNTCHINYKRYLLVMLQNGAKQRHLIVGTSTKESTGTYRMEGLEIFLGLKKHYMIAPFISHSL